MMKTTIPPQLIQKCSLPSHTPDSSLFISAELSHEDPSTIYRSLVSLVKIGYPFHDALQDKTVQFLNSLEPIRFFKKSADEFITKIASNNNDPFGEFVDSVVTILSSSHSSIVDAALSFSSRFYSTSSKPFQLQLMEADFLSRVLTSIQPQTRCISSQSSLHSSLISVLESSLSCASTNQLEILLHTTPIDEHSIRELIFHKVVFPSSPYLLSVCHSQRSLSNRLSGSFMLIFGRLILISPLHRPTLEFVLTSPLLSTFSSCLSYVEHWIPLWTTLFEFDNSLKDWKNKGAEVVISGKQIIQALFAEGFEDTLEAILMHDEDGFYGVNIVTTCISVSQRLGSNVMRL
ncbi:hypothetical protein BLNAU_4317 [Blattamonas nauphoetae]|uniref:Uncharacterized protein n=1 Tax=Blattamonas nauphoetae TaxID=2049346 RepID=A0ABQ9YA73_9EUKA|nr:hypothetical protein BLNAU_4317 [Blattamonas nauphoetae]